MSPDDPLGTVRAGDGTLAIRARSAQPEFDGELSWIIVDIGGDILSRIDPDGIEQLIGAWPVVYQLP